MQTLSNGEEVEKMKIVDLIKELEQRQAEGYEEIYIQAVSSLDETYLDEAVWTAIDEDTGKLMLN
jgi:hypothetical protein